MSPNWRKIIYFSLLTTITIVDGIRTYSKNDLINLRYSKNSTFIANFTLKSCREEVRAMFYHAYDSYLKYAYPYDELRPISCDGIDTYGR